MALFHCGRNGTRIDSDCRISFEPSTTGPLTVSIRSKVETYYGESLRALFREGLDFFGIQHGTLTVEDHGALPFVLMARLETVIKAAFPHIERNWLPERTQSGRPPRQRDRFRRSRLYLPGNQPKLMLNAGLHHPDGIILDLEDAVAPAEKIAARHIVRNALRVLDFFGCETMVRINQGPQGLEDLKGIGLGQVDLVLVPKVEEAQSIMEMDHLLSPLEEASDEHPGVLLMPILESAKGILNAREIANASQRIVALAIGLEDYTADLGTARTQEGRESFFARSMLVNAARAAGIQAIDTVFSDVADQEGLRASVLEAKALGFDGKGCIHPRQIQIIHEAFAPSPEEIKRSLAIKEAFDQATAQQLGVVALGAKMIDAPVVKRALHLVTLAQRMGLLPEENGGGNV